MAVASVRYIVADVDDAIGFYCGRLGFTEIMHPAPFMHPLGSRAYGTGNVYEMRTYTYAPGDIPKVLDGWSKAIDAREKFSPLAACWTSWVSK